MCSHEVQQLSDSQTAAHKNVSGHLHAIKSLPKNCPKKTYLKADVKFSHQPLNRFKTTVTHN